MFKFQIPNNFNIVYLGYLGKATYHQVSIFYTNFQYKIVTCLIKRKIWLHDEKMRMHDKLLNDQLGETATAKMKSHASHCTIWK